MSVLPNATIWQGSPPAPDHQPIPAEIVKKMDWLEDQLTVLTFGSRAEAEAATNISEFVKRVSVLTPSGQTIFYVVDPSGEALTLNAGAIKLSPDGDVTPDHYQENTTPNTTNMLVGFTGMVAWMNANVENGDLLHTQYLTGSVPKLTAQGVGIYGRGKGNVANLSPAVDAPTTVTITGTGHGFHLENQSQTLTGFRLTSDTTRAALAFDIDQPGVRVEPADTASTERADKCRVDLRIDNQPGDGILAVGPITYLNPSDCEIYECAGFGLRGDPGLHPDLVRTNPHYPGLIRGVDMRIGYCGGHAIALSHPLADQQAEMAVRCDFFNLDTFGNGVDTSIMYASADSEDYTVWIFGENCSIVDSAIDGKQGPSPLTDEILGGVWIAGRENTLRDVRFIQCKQPIYWGHVTAQPSSGLTVDGVRVVNASLTHDFLVEMESVNSTGLRVTLDNYENINNTFDPLVGTDTVDAVVQYGARYENLSAITHTDTTITLADDAVHTIPLRNVSASAGAQARLTFIPSSITIGYGEFHMRLGGASPLATRLSTDTNLEGATGALTGTTGTDTKITISCDADTIYIENRRGYPITFNYQLDAASPQIQLI